MHHENADKQANYPDQQNCDSQLRLPSLPHRPPIVEQIMSQAITDPQVMPYRDRAQFTFFCGDLPESLGGRDGQLEVVGRCLEWFVFDYTIPELEMTPAQHWLNLYACRLTPEQYACATDCLNFVLGIFEISQLDAAYGFVAIDLLRPGKSYRVCEHTINNELRPGQLLLGRLFPQRNEYILSGMAAIMNHSATMQIKQLISSGRLKPQSILDDLDGLELENLYGRSLMNIDKVKDLNLLYQRLQNYFQNIVPNQTNFSELQKSISAAQDPVELAVSACRRLNIHCRHEIELVLTYIMTYWFRTH